MNDIFSTCIQKIKGKYKWNAWRLLSDFELQLKECDIISNKILNEIDNKNKTVLTVLAKSGIPLIPVSLQLDLPLFLYKRQHFMIGSTVGTTTIIPFQHHNYLPDKDFFLLDTQVCSGRLMEASANHFKRHKANFKKMYALVSYHEVQDLKMGWLYKERAKKIEYLYSIEKDENKILQSINADNNKGIRDEIRKYSFWSLEDESIYYNLNIKQKKITKKNYKDLVKICGNSNILKDILKVITKDEYINVERLFIYPKLLSDAVKEIIKCIPIFDYDIICGMSDVGVVLATYLAFILHKKGIFKGKLAYIGRTSARFGSLVWPDTLNLRDKKILLVDTKIRCGDVCAFSYHYLKKEEKISKCDIAIIMEYGDLDDKKYYWFLLENGVKIYTIFKHDYPVKK